MQLKVSSISIAKDKRNAIILALLVHALFVMFLVFGVSWHRTLSGGFEAEIWTEVPKPDVAGSRHPTLTPQPEPPQPRPKPAPPPPPQPVTPQPKVQPTPPKVTEMVEKSDIALKKKKLEEAKAKKLAHEKQLKEMIKQEQEAARRELQEDQRRAKAKAAAARTKALEDKQAQAAQQKQAAEREVQLDAFKLAIIAKIKHHTKVPLGVPQGMTTVVKITVLPDGTVLNKVVTRSSGNAAYDDAVLLGIDRSQPLPLPEDIQVRRQFRDLELTFTHEK